MTGIGTVVNVVAIASGSAIGGLFRSRIPTAWHRPFLDVLAVFTLLLGLQMFISASQLGIPPLLSLVAALLGVLVGEILQLEQRLQTLAQSLEVGLRQWGWLDPQLAEAFITSSLLFGIGPMAIIGALRDGLSQDPSLLYIKSAMDGVVSIVFAASIGLGTILACGTVLLYQGSITLLAAQIQPWVTPHLLGVINGVGSLMLVSIGLNLLNLTRIRAVNLLPALAIAPLLLNFLPGSQL